MPTPYFRLRGEINLEVILRNLQSIEEATLVFPENGVVCMSGDNSNGKSIFAKTLGAITSGNWEDYDVRRPLISDGCTEGAILMQARGKVLIVRLHDDRNQCVVSLKRENGTEIVRTFREGGIDDLLFEFGFRTYGSNKLCLQIYETFGLMPFVNTSDKVDFEMIDTIGSDTNAELFVKNFKEITFKEAKAKLKILDERISNIASQRASLNLYDWKAYDALTKRLINVNALLKCCAVLDLKEIPIPPSVTIIDITSTPLAVFPFQKIMPIVEPLEDMSSAIHNLNELLAGRCPTCGKSLVADYCQRGGQNA